MAALEEELLKVLNEPISALVPTNLVYNMLLQSVLKKTCIKIAKALVDVKKKYLIEFEPAFAFAFILSFKNRKFDPINFNDNVIALLYNAFQKEYYV